MPLRQPSPASQSSALPTLEEVRAGAHGPQPTGVGRRAELRAVGAGAGVALAGVVGAHLLGAHIPPDAPQCGDSRVDELTAHAGAIAQAARRADIAQTLREIGVATGIVPHGSTTIGHEVMAAGAMPVTRADPPEPQPTPQLDPSPPPPGAMAIPSPVPVTPTPPPRVQHHPTPRQHISGGARAVHPAPHEPPETF